MMDSPIVKTTRDLLLPVPATGFGGIIGTPKTLEEYKRPRPGPEGGSHAPL